MKLFNKNKKGNAFKMLGQLALSIALIAIILVTTFLIMSQGKNQIAEVEGFTLNTTSCATSLSCNATTVLQGAVDDLPPWIPLIVIVGIGMVMITMIGMFTNSRR